MKLFWTTENAWTFAMDENPLSEFPSTNRNVYWTSVGVYLCVCVCVRMRARVSVGVNSCGLNAHAERFNWHFPIVSCDILQCVRCNTKYANVDTFASVSAKHLTKNNAIAMHNALITMIIYTHILCHHYMKIHNTFKTKE